VLASWSGNDAGLRIGETLDIAEAVETLALRVGLVDRGAPARTIHLIDREEIDGGALGEIAERCRRVLG